MDTEPIVIFDTKALKRYWLEVGTLPEDVTLGDVGDIMHSGKKLFEIPISQCIMILRGKIYFIRRNRKRQYIVYNILGDYDGLGTDS